MRPTYETESDQSNELEAKAILEKAWAVRLDKLPISYHADWAASKNGRVMGFIEYKRRNMEFGTYQTIMLSYLKFTALNSLIAASGDKQLRTIVAKFVIQANNGIYYCDLRPNIPGAYVEFGGRTLNTRDSADIEPVIHIPTSHFTKLEIQ